LSHLQISAPGASATFVGGGDWQKHASDAVASKRNVPHYYLTVTVDCTRILELREGINSGVTEEDTSVGVMDFAIMAAGKAMGKVPSVNGHWLQDGSGVRVYDDCDVNLHCGSGEGAYRSIIRGANRSGLRSIAEQTSNLQPTNDIGTFSIINLGMYGVKVAAPVIVEPQSCFLAMGGIQEVVKSNGKGGYKYVSNMEVTMSCDHRVVDGAVGAEWLQAFREGMEKPESMLL